WDRAKLPRVIIPIIPFVARLEPHVVVPVPVVAGRATNERDEMTVQWVRALPSVLVARDSIRWFEVRTFLGIPKPIGKVDRSPLLSMVFLEELDSVSASGGRRARELERVDAVSAELPAPQIPRFLPREAKRAVLFILKRVRGSFHRVSPKLPALGKLFVFGRRQ